MTSLITLRNIFNIEHILLQVKLNMPCQKCLIMPAKFLDPRKKRASTDKNEAHYRHDVAQNFLPEVRRILQVSTFFRAKRVSFLQVTFRTSAWVRMPEIQLQR